MLSAFVSRAPSVAAAHRPTTEYSLPSPVRSFLTPASTDTLAPLLHPNACNDRRRLGAVCLSDAPPSARRAAVTDSTRLPSQIPTTPLPSTSPTHSSWICDGNLNLSPNRLRHVLIPLRLQTVPNTHKYGSYDSVSDAF